MRIISKFFDYYDKALAHGIDPKLVYVRETKQVDVGSISYKESNKHNLRTNSEVFRLADTIGNAFNFVCQEVCLVVCFCGRMYPVYNFNFGHSESLKGYKHYYSIESLRADVFSKAFEDKLFEDFGYDGTAYTLSDLRKVLNNEKNHLYWGDSVKIEEFDSYIGKEIGDDIFRHFDVPILAIPAKGRSRDIKVTLNPRLNEIDFIKVVDPVTAFQEISMYLGSNLAKQKDPDVKLSDEVKAEIHGFDKWSFRRPKDTRKRKR